MGTCVLLCDVGEYEGLVVFLFVHNIILYVSFNYTCMYGYMQIQPHALIIIIIYNICIAPYNTIL